MIHRLTDVDPYSVRVSVYRNLRTGGWSVKTAERVGDIRPGRVIAHADQCFLVDAEFQVYRTGWLAYFHGTGKRGRRRNVFGWVTGKLADAPQVIPAPRRVCFHPSERGDFYDAQTGETVTHADAVQFTAEGKCWAA